MRIKGILIILLIVAITGIVIVFSTNQTPPPGLSDLHEISDEITIALDADRIDTVEASDEVTIDEQIENEGVGYYIDEDGVKHFIIEAEDEAITTE